MAELCLQVFELMKKKINIVLLFIFYSKNDDYYEGFEVAETIEQTAEELSYAGFPCGHCEYAATDGANLKKHIEAKHLGVRYSCELCPYQATQKQNLKRHYKLKHSPQQ